MTAAQDQLDSTFAALADPTRRAIVARLAQGDATVNELAAPFAMTPPGDLQAPQGARALRPHLADQARAVPALPSGGRGSRLGRELDRGEPQDLDGAVRQAR